MDNRLEPDFIKRNTSPVGNRDIYNRLCGIESILLNIQDMLYSVLNSQPDEEEEKPKKPWM